MDKATFAPEQIGRTRSITPEGYLLCEEVPIARTGPMFYAAHEVPALEVDPARGNIIIVDRAADVLFDADNMNSFNGKPVTNDHPAKFVSPANFKKLVVGVTLNPRRGTGELVDYLVADLLITDADTIDDVNKGKRAISPGYDAKLEKVKPGFGRQTKVLCNHVALVMKGRGGPTCALRDGDQPMKLIDKAMDWLKGNPTKTLEDAYEAVAGDGGTQVAPSVRIDLGRFLDEATKDVDTKVADEAIETRFKALEDGQAAVLAAVTKLTDSITQTTDAATAEAAAAAKVVTDAEAAKTTATMDAAAAALAYNDVVAKAEILQPGITVQAMDAAAPAASIVAAQRKVLETLNLGPRRSLMASLCDAAVDLTALPDDHIKLIFEGATAVAKAQNKPTMLRNPIMDRAYTTGPVTAAKQQELMEAARKSLPAS